MSQMKSSLACAGVVVAAVLGLAACVGPDGEDGRGYSQNRDRHGSAYDPGYDQRRSGAYRHDPSMTPDQQEPNYGWWPGNAYPRDRRND